MSRAPAAVAFSRQESLLGFFVFAALGGVLKLLGERHAVYNEVQNSIVVILKPVGDVVEIVPNINPAGGENTFAVDLARNRGLKGHIVIILDGSSNFVRISVLSSQCAGHLDISNRLAGISLCGRVLSRCRLP